MKVDRKAWGRVARAAALVCTLGAALVFGVSSGTAGFGAALSPAVVVGSPSADLGVSMLDSSDPAVIGTGFEYTITVTNDGPDAATGAVLHYGLSGGLGLKGVSGARCDGTTCLLGDLASGAKAQLVLYVYGTTTGLVLADASVASQTADSNPDNDNANESTTIVDRATPRATLNVVSHVVDDNGGTAKAGDFDFVVDGVNADPSSFPGNEDGTSVSLDAADYKVSLEDGPSGYDVSYSDDCSGSMAAGDQKTCTVTLDDQRAHLRVIEQVDNANGGDAGPSDFSLAVKGGTPDPAEFSGNGEGTDVSLDAGDYAVSQETAYGYRTSLSAGCEGTVVPGEQRTCTVTNVHLAPVTLELSANAPQVAAGASTGYTVTLKNTNPTPATVSYVRVLLPIGFSYRSGSTKGTITSDPSIEQGEGLSLAWNDPVQLAGGESKSFHFGVRVPATLGAYDASASGGVDAPDTLDATSNPQIMVVDPPPVPSTSGSGPTAPPPSNPPQQGAPPITQGAPPVAPPLFQQDADATPVSGNVLVRLPGTTSFVPLTSAEQVGFGTEFDTTDGRVTLTTVDSDGTVYHADFYEGTFLLAKQLPNGVSLLQLTRGDFKSCTVAKRTFSSVDTTPKKAKRKAKRSKKVVRHLWGSGKGKFRTKGRFIAATVHGTTWLTEDRCDGTRAYVQEGVVDVRDLVKHKTIQLGAGQSYVARPGH